MNYVVIESYSIEELQEEVGLYLQRGYRPHGGISVTSWRHEGETKVIICYAQAMIYDRAEQKQAIRKDRIRWG